MWCVGTKLTTAYDQPALGGVYKLTAIRRPGEDWKYRLKLSEQAAKISNPGLLQVRRFHKGGEFQGDAIHDEFRGIDEPCVIVDPLDHTRHKEMSGLEHEDLLVPIFREGRLVYERPPLDESRRRTQTQLAALHAGIKRLEFPHQYPVGLESGLHALKTELVLKARERVAKERQ